MTRPITGRAASVVAAVGTQNPDLELLDEVGAVAGAALVINALHEQLAGEVPKVATATGLRSPRTLRGMLAGEKNLSLVRLLAICLNFPQRTRRTVQVLNDVLGYEMPTPGRRATGSIETEFSDLGPEFGALVAEYAVARADGHWSYDEVDGLLRRLDSLVCEAVELRAALKRELGLAGVREGLVSRTAFVSESQ